MNNQAKQIQYFLFNEKYFHIDVSRCVIAPQHIQYEALIPKHLHPFLCENMLSGSGIDTN